MVDIKDCLDKAMEKTLKFYETNFKELKDNLKKLTSPYHPYVFWNESDFRTALVFNLTKELREGYIIHTEVNMRKNSFIEEKNELGELEEVWRNAIESIIQYKKKILGQKRPRAGDIDIVITGRGKLPIEDTLPFRMCIEVKYYHYDPRNFKRDINRELVQIKALEILKEYGLTDDISVIIGYRKEIDFIKKLKEELSNKNYVKFIYFGNKGCTDRI